jgi:hypothetical protein
MTRSLEATLKDFVGLFREAQPSDFIAAEFLVSSELIGNMNPKSKLARAIRQAEVSFPKEGFNWWAPPKELGSIVNATRAEIARLRSEEDMIRVMYDLISEPDPAFLSGIRVN